MHEFRELYEKYNRYIFQFLLKFTNYNWDLADELTQETFFQVYLSLPKYKGISSIQTWICSIAKNVCFKYFKKNPIMTNLDELENQSWNMKSVTMEEMIEQKELLQYTIQEIMSLKQKFSDVLVYRLFFELSFKEISHLLEITESSAKVIYYRGKSKVRERMEEFWNE